MSTKEHIPGKAVYNRQGEVARYVAETTEGHIVVPRVTVLDPEGNDLAEDGLIAAWHEVFDSPPKAVLDTEIAAASERLKGLREQIQVARSDFSLMEAEISERKKRISRHEQLKQLDEFLTNGITHYVNVNYGRLSIIALTDAKSEYGPREEFRLLCLFGGSKGDLTWRLNQYNDGSGSYSDVYPCTSLEQAQSKAAELLGSEWSAWRGNPDKYHYLSSFAESADKLKIPVPDDVRTKIKAEAIKKAKEVVEAAKKNLAASELLAAKAESKP